MSAGIMLNREALLDLGRRAVVAIVEHRGEIPTGHEVDTEIALLHDAGRARVDFFLEGARVAAELMAPSIEAKAVASYQRLLANEVAHAEAKIRAFQDEADIMRERAERAEAVRDRYWLGERTMVWGGALLLGAGVFATFAAGAFAILGRLGR